jgi:hypothetical protein
MAAQRHVIKRQVVQLTMTEAHSAHTMQQELGRIYRQRLLPIIERHCNELSVPDCLYRIPRLDLDLGRVDMAHLEEELVAKVNAALPRELTDHIKRQEISTATAPADPKTASQLELFALFVRHGTLPWWTDPTQPNLLENCLHYLLRHAPLLLQQLLQELLKEERGLQRIIQHFGDGDLTKITTLFTPLSAEFLLQFVTALKTLHPQMLNKLSAPQCRYRIWREILTITAVTGTGQNNPLEFVRVLLPRLATSLEVAYPLLLTSLQVTVKTSDHRHISEIAAILAEEREVTAQTPFPLMDKGESEDLAAARLFASDPSLSDTLNASIVQVKSVFNPNFTDTEELYLNNAGLVLLWPFLGTFFEHLGLVVDGLFRDTMAIHRAIALLHYLTSGDPATPPEYLLPLNKLLCGLDLDQAYIMDIPLTDFELQECEELLDAVIEHASVLNHMSNSGFRGTFLLRQGQLSSRDGAWLLRVERETFDIVLERFPWSVEWVKLSWMNLPLRVEW